MGINGTVQGECIKCPFHHWAFNGKSGELENIPYSDDKKVDYFSSRVRK